MLKKVKIYFFNATTSADNDTLNHWLSIDKTRLWDTDGNNDLQLTI